MSDGTAARAWVAATAALGGRVEAARDAGAELARRYAEPHRSYHTGAHVDAVVREVAELAGAEHLDEAESAAVTLAACAHDVVYDARPGADERASAEWARSRLTRCGLATAVADRVVELVLTTITHLGAPGDLGAAVLLDADLAILGAPPTDYAGYVTSVRREYAAVPDAEWRTGRAAVLDALLTRPRLYLTASAFARWEEPARRNVEAELRELRRGAQ
jgi:predicted metal-dependent HD superfamily phosphohydrolase